MCESTNRYDINTGNGYYGAYQFDLSDLAVGGRFRSTRTRRAPAEQDYRALILYRNRGWNPWVCARLVGLSEDSDARTRVAPPVGGNQSSRQRGERGLGRRVDRRARRPTRVGSSREGDSSEELKAWQKQMGTRGYDLVGTGYFGPKTKAAVLDLQAKAGLNVVGYIGPKTWAAAWSGAQRGPGRCGAGGVDLHAGDQRVLRGRQADRADLAGQAVRPGRHRPRPAVLPASAGQPRATG